MSEWVDCRRSNSNNPQWPISSIISINETSFEKYEKSSNWDGRRNGGDTGEPGKRQQSHSTLVIRRPIYGYYLTVHTLKGVQNIIIENKILGQIFDFMNLN